MENFLDQMLSQQIEGAVILKVVLEQELFVLVLNEVLRIALPRAKINLGQEMLGDKLKDLASPILSILLLRQVTVRYGYL